MTTDSNLRSGSDLQIGFICQWNRYVRKACFGDNKYKIETLVFHVGIWLSYISAVREGFRLFGSSLTSTPSSFLPSCPPTIHPVPRSWGMQWNLLHCWGWRRREWGFGGRLVQTRDKRASDAPFLLWTMHHAPCTMHYARSSVLHCWKSMHCALNAMYLLWHCCKASKLRTYVQRKQGLGGLRHFFLFIQLMARTNHFS